MPTCFEISGYKIYFWSNENGEEVHVHIAKGKPVENGTKVWLLSDGSTRLEHNKSRISQHELNKLLRIIDRNYILVLKEWCAHFNLPPKFKA